MDVFAFLVYLMIIFFMYLVFPLIISGIVYFISRNSKRKWFYSIGVLILVLVLELLLVNSLKV